MKFKHFLLMLSVSAGSLLATSSLAQPDFTTDASGTSLTLINGWYNAPFSTNAAKVVTQSGIVHFKGAIGTSGTNDEPFILPSAYRPSSVVWIPVDLCDAKNGRLVIYPNGAVLVEAESSWSDAQCFTSLDGASFALNGSGFSNLTLINGWHASAYVTSTPSAKKINGIVHLRGAIGTSGTNNNNTPFVLPAAFRPETYTLVPIDLCSGTNGQLDIAPSGEVFIETETAWSNAQCFTSLDGVSFPTSYSGFKDMTPTNGWVSEYQPAVKSSQGVVSFQGAIYTSGSNSEPFVLPSSYRPSKAVYVPVTLCDAAYGVANGRLYIQPSGVVEVQAQNSFAEAQCLTSLDGASFVK